MDGIRSEASKFTVLNSSISIIQPDISELDLSMYHIINIGQLLVAISLPLLLLSNCSTLESRHPNVGSALNTWPHPDRKKRNENYVKGLPYHLPTTHLKVTLETKEASGKKNSTIQLTPTIVPDPSRRFVLKRSPNLIFERTHNFSLEDGLLTSVATTDVSKLGDSVREVASLILSIGAGSPIQVPRPLSSMSASEIAEAADLGLASTSFYPTGEEITQILAMIPLGKQEYSVPLAEGFDYPVPGTQDILRLVAHSLGDSIPYDHLPTFLNRPTGTAKAILARTLTTQQVKAELQISLSALNQWRLERDEAVKAQIQSTIKRLEAAEAPLKTRDEHLTALVKDTDGRGLMSEPSPFTVRLLAAEEKKSTNSLALEAAKAALQSIEKNIKAHEGKKRGYLTVRTVTQPMLVTDDLHTYAVPIESALLGTTSNTVTLNKGIVTAVAATEPSLLYEFVKIPADIVRSAVGLSTTKANNEAAALEAQTKLIEAKAKLKSAESGEAKPENE